MKKSLLTLLNAAYALAGIAAVFLIWAVLSATVLKPSDRVEASFDPVAAGAKSPVLITSPGVLNALPGEVHATVTVPNGEQVAVAIGRTADVDGWSSSYRVAEITGIVDWETLTSVNLDPNTEVATVAPSPAASETATESASAAATESASAAATPTPGDAASAEPSSSPDANGTDTEDSEELDTAAMQAALTSSDMWTTAKSASGEVKLKLKPEVDNVSLIAVGSSSAPRLTLSWAARDRSTFLIPGLLWAALFLALAGGVYYIDLLFKREAERRRRNAEKRAAKRAATTQSMRAIDPNSPPPLSRRELARLGNGQEAEDAPQSAAKERQSILGRRAAKKSTEQAWGSDAGSGASESDSTAQDTDSTDSGRSASNTSGGFLGAYMPQWPAATSTTAELADSPAATGGESPETQNVDDVLAGQDGKVGGVDAEEKQE